MLRKKNLIASLPTIAIDSDKFTTLYQTSAFQQTLIELIEQAKKRIYLVALYLEDDEAGQMLMTALYQAKAKNPLLDIQICVDWHRAQRGLIGAAATKTNADMYARYANQNEHHIPVHGIPVRGREVLGVLHLKGMIIDDTVVYSGASINNVYLGFKDKYRFDRYHVIESPKLANTMTQFITTNLINQPAVFDLAKPLRPKTKEIRHLIRQLRLHLTHASYQFISEHINDKQLALTPIVGVGKKNNLLNQAIVKLIANAQAEIIICTPYFNFPRAIANEVKKALKRGIKVSIIVGDKTANDFYISPEAPFKTIGGLPYLYENNLRTYAKLNENFLRSGQLNIHLWNHDDNTFHLKGMWVDKKNMLITGNNLNPRAWKLDLENALLIQDNNTLLIDQFEQEFDNILAHTTRICTYKQFESIDTYPDKVQKLIRKIKRVRAEHVLKQLL